MPNTHPKLHNAAWPGVFGKGSPGAEPVIDLDTMLALTAKANVDGVKFDGVALFLFAPHVDIDASDDDLKRLPHQARARPPPPPWRGRRAPRGGPPGGGGGAWGSEAERKQCVEQVKKGCRIAKKLR